MTESPKTARSAFRFWLRMLPVVVVAGVVAIELSRTQQGDDYPNRPIKIVVPFKAGGGSDRFARMIENEMRSANALPQPLVIINIGGAGATIGSRRVKTAKPDGYTILMLHEAILTAKYSGSAAYGPEAFEPIAGTGRLGLVIVVRDDVPFQNLNELLHGMQKTAEPLVWAMNQYTPSHFAGLLLEKEYAKQTMESPKFRFAHYGGGADRLAAVKSGKAMLSAFSEAEYQAFQPEGIRALAYCGPERSQHLPDVPTAREQGIEIVSQNMHFWWAPKGTPQPRIERFAAALEQVMQSPAVQEKLRRENYDPVFVRGEQMQAEVDWRNDALSRVDLRPSHQPPNFPWWIACATMLVGGIAVVEHLRTRFGKLECELSAKDEIAAAPPQPLRAWLVFGLVTGFVAILGTGWFSFRHIASVFAFGSLLALHYPRHPNWPVTVVFSLLLGYGLEFVFTHIFTIDLP